MALEFTARLTNSFGHAPHLSHHMGASRLDTVLTASNDRLFTIVSSPGKTSVESMLIVPVAPEPEPAEPVRPEQSASETTIANEIAPLFPDGPWQCTACTMINYKVNAAVCDVCETPNPNYKALDPNQYAMLANAMQANLNLAPWNCSACTSQNPITATVCMVCETPRQLNWGGFQEPLPQVHQPPLLNFAEKKVDDDAKLRKRHCIKNYALLEETGDEKALASFSCEQDILYVYYPAIRCFAKLDIKEDTWTRTEIATEAKSWQKEVIFMTVKDSVVVVVDTSMNVHVMYPDDAKKSPLTFNAVDLHKQLQVNWAHDDDTPLLCAAWNTDRKQCDIYAYSRKAGLFVLNITSLFQPDPDPAIKLEWANIEAGMGGPADSLIPLALTHTATDGIVLLLAASKRLPLFRFDTECKTWREVSFRYGQEKFVLNHANTDVALAFVGRDALVLQRNHNHACTFTMHPAKIIQIPTKYRPLEEKDKYMSPRDFKCEHSTLEWHKLTLPMSNHPWTGLPSLAQTPLICYSNKVYAFCPEDPGQVRSDDSDSDTDDDNNNFSASRGVHGSMWHVVSLDVDNIDVNAFQDDVVVQNPDFADFFDETAGSLCDGDEQRITVEHSLLPSATDVGLGECKFMVHARTHHMLSGHVAVFDEEAKAIYYFGSGNALNGFNHFKNSPWLGPSSLLLLRFDIVSSSLERIDTVGSFPQVPDAVLKLPKYGVFAAENVGRGLYNGSLVPGREFAGQSFTSENGEKFLLIVGGQADRQPKKLDNVHPRMGVWLLHLATSTWLLASTEGDTPIVSWGHGIAKESRDKFWIFGGIHPGPTAHQDLLNFVLSGSRETGFTVTWEDRTVRTHFIPTARAFVNMFSVADGFLVYGGRQVLYSSSVPRDKDVHFFSYSSYRWSIIGSFSESKNDPPTPEFMHTCLLSTQNRSLKLLAFPPGDKDNLNKVLAAAIRPPDFSKTVRRYQIKDATSVVASLEVRYTVAMRAVVIVVSSVSTADDTERVLGFTFKDLSNTHVQKQDIVPSRGLILTKDTTNMVICEFYHDCDAMPVPMSFSLKLVCKLLSEQQNELFPPPTKQFILETVARSGYWNRLHLYKPVECIRLQLENVQDTLRHMISLRGVCYSQSTLWRISVRDEDRRALSALTISVEGTELTLNSMTPLDGEPIKTIIKPVEGKFRLNILTTKTQFIVQLSSALGGFCEARMDHRLPLNKDHLVVSQGPIDVTTAELVELSPAVELETRTNNENKTEESLPEKAPVLQVQQTESLVANLNAIRTYETKESLYHVVGSEGFTRYATLLLRCQTEGKLFVDPFWGQVNPSCLFEGGKHVTSWLRPSAFCSSPRAGLFVEGKDPSERGREVIQGELGNCWLMCALSAMAQRLELLKAIFVPTGLSHMGVYSVRFFKNGVWRIEVIDDMIPCGKSRTPVYAHNLPPTDPKAPVEFWVALLEKAYAKLHQSYTNLDGDYGGNIRDALVDLTGGVPIVYNFVAGSEDVTSGELFNTMLAYHRDGHLMGCGTVPTKRRPHTSSWSYAGQGIIMNHAYAIMNVLQIDENKLLMLRNPLSETEWVGAWSRTCKLWKQNPKVEAACKSSMAQRENNDGVFFMTYADFIVHFNILHVVKCFQLTEDSSKSEFAPPSFDTHGRSPLMYKKTFFGSWDAKNNGGGRPSLHAGWRRNTQYNITIAAEAKSDDDKPKDGVDMHLVPVTIVLSQDDVRMKNERTSAFHEIGFFVTEIAQPGYRTLDTPGGVYHCTHTGVRGLTAELKLQRGKCYTIAPSTFFKEVPLNYILDVYVPAECKSIVTCAEITNASGDWKSDSVRLQDLKPIVPKVYIDRDLNKGDYCRFYTTDRVKRDQPPDDHMYFICMSCHEERMVCAHCRDTCHSGDAHAVVYAPPHPNFPYRHCSCGAGELGKNAPACLKMPTKSDWKCVACSTVNDQARTICSECFGGKKIYVEEVKVPQLTRAASLRQVPDSVTVSPQLIDLAVEGAFGFVTLKLVMGREKMAQSADEDEHVTKHYGFSLYRVKTTPQPLAEESDTKLSMESSDTKIENKSDNGTSAKSYIVTKENEIGSTGLVCQESEAALTVSTPLLEPGEVLLLVPYQLKGSDYTLTVYARGEGSDDSVHFVKTSPITNVTGDGISKMRDELVSVAEMMVWCVPRGNIKLKFK